MSRHYENYSSIKTIEDLKKIFPDGEANEMNWCVFSTSGVHGTYTTINDIENYLVDPERIIEEENGGESYTPNLTVLVIMPRLVSMSYGNIEVSAGDIPYLKRLANSSIEAIRSSQQGNF